MSDRPRRRWPLVVALGTGQTLAWASSYYLLAILAAPMARNTGMSTTEVFAAFSTSLLISALIGPRVGRAIDELGGRGVLALSNIVFACGLGVLGLAASPAMVWVGWLVMGLGMGLGLYDSAFAALGRIYGSEARLSITGVTLIAGFASTVGWPLTTWGEHDLGWRGACFAWGLAHLLVGLPIHLLAVPTFSRPAALRQVTPQRPQVRMDRTMWLLGFAFAAGWTVSTAMAAHLPRLLELSGASLSEAVLAGALIGPAQVAARIAEVGYLNRFHPLLSARLATLAHPIGAALLIGSSGWLSAPFAIMHGAGNGILTIARGTVTLAVFGPKDYGYRLGLIGAPARVAQAAAPLVFGVLIEQFGRNTVLVSAAVSLLATLALILVRPRRAPDPDPHAPI